MFKSLQVIFAVFFVHHVSTEPTPIIPRLELINGDNFNNTYTIYTKEIPDTGNDPMFREALSVTTKICTIGIWRFYPEPNFEVNPSSPLINGHQIGTTEKYKCQDDARNLAILLRSMGSYRYLGPSDLNKFSISVYSEEYSVGVEVVFDSLKEFEYFDKLPFPVKSYVITGITDPNVTNQLTLAPVVKVYWEENDKEGKQVCLAVVNEDLDGNGRSKLYYRTSMQPIEGIEPNDPVKFESFIFLRFSTANIPGFCDVNPGDALGMIKLPHTPPIPPTWVH